MFPKRRKKPRMGLRESARIKCPAHLRYVRGFECVAGPLGKYGCQGRIEAHHVRTRGAGGGDEQVVPLCSLHHAQLDSPGWSSKKFEAVYAIDMKAIAERLWFRSPHRRKHEKRRAA